jgi:hypothetical protein
MDFKVGFWKIHCGVVNHYNRNYDNGCNFYDDWGEHMPVQIQDCQRTIALYMMMEKK